MLGWLKKTLLGKICMLIFLSTNSLSSEALKSSLMWIGLAAIWTWTVIARSLHYQTSRCQSFCPGWADKHRRKRQFLSWGAYTQANRNSPIRISAPFPRGIGGWNLPEGLAHGYSGKCHEIGTCVWWQSERWWHGDKAMFIPMRLSSRLKSWGFTGCP